MRFPCRILLLCLFVSLRASAADAVHPRLCFDAWKGQTVPAQVTWKDKTYDLPKEYAGMDLNQAVSKALLANARPLWS